MGLVGRVCHRKKSAPQDNGAKGWGRRQYDKAAKIAKVPDYSPHKKKNPQGQMPPMTECR